MRIKKKTKQNNKSESVNFIDSEEITSEGVLKLLTGSVYTLIYIYLIHI